MRLPTFDYHAPHGLAEVLALLDEHAGDCKLLAGGTDVFPALKTGRFTTGHVIDLKRIEALDTLAFELESGLTIGATVALTRIEKHPAVVEHYPALAASIWELATVQVRNKATAVGNLCNASPAADAATPLMAYGAIAVVAGPDGERKVAVEDLLTGPGRLALAPTELVTALHLPAPAASLRAKYLKFSPRSKVDIAAVNLTAALDFDHDENVTSADLFLGTVAPIPMRAKEAAAALLGVPLSAETLAAAATAAHDECSPITDFRATAAYKRRIVAVLVRRALEALAPSPIQS
jgi:carbon-monoxide dehydrogenase medium subunit